jgi:ABC-type branched-subunit amino acid transport system permease subunit
MAEKKKMSRTLRSQFITYGIVVVFFVACEILIATHILSYSLQGQLVPICAYACMAIALNLVVGISGELSLGHAGFMSIGAFSGAVVSIVLAQGIPYERWFSCWRCWWVAYLRVCLVFLSVSRSCVSMGITSQS